MTNPAPPISPDAPWLAPLAGFSDLAFRLLCREQGAAVACTEMVSAKGLVYGSPGTEPLLVTTPEDDPLVVQLFGSQEEFMEQAMDILVKRGVAWFDLNAGCSVRKVVKTGAGAALLRDPDRLVALAATMARKAPGRTGVKLRLGFGADQDMAVDIARRLEDAGAAWLTLHPRTAAQGFSGRADWARARNLKRAVSVPVMVSGDLFTAQDAVDCLAESGADGIMFARGAMYDPSVFARYAALTRGLPMPRRDGPSTAALIRRHAELARGHLSGRSALLKMRTIVPRYVKGLPGAGRLRDKLSRCTSWKELEALVDEHLGHSYQPSPERN